MPYGIRSLLSLLLLSCACLPSRGQVSRRDLEGIEAHRNPVQDVPILQSVSDSASGRTASLIGTWDFLCEEDSEQEEETEVGGEIVPETVEQRILALPPELLVPYRPLILDRVTDYISRHRSALRGILGKYRYREAYLRAAFKSQGIPEELSALAIVESAMNPKALSRAGARGLWQLMPQTALRYGMRCDEYVDERLDVSVATPAAVRYLRTAYERYGDWPLAISSYNCGFANTDRAIEKAQSTDFWDVYPYLPAETKEYMPYFIAALYSVNYHKEHGIDPRPYSEPAMAAFNITRYMTFREVCKATGIGEDDLSRYNPQYLLGIVPGSPDKRQRNILRIPRKYSKKFKENIK